MILFSQHARQRRKYRNISVKRIRDTVGHPDEIIHSIRGRTLRRKKFGDKLLEVVTVEEGENIVVITQYYLENTHEN